MTWEELNEFRNRKDRLIPIITLFPENPPSDDKMKDLLVAENWVNVLKRQKELTSDWNQPDSRSVTPIQRYRDLAHLRQIVLEQFRRVLGAILKPRMESERTSLVESQEVRTLPELGIAYETTAKSRHPCIGAKISDLGWDRVKIFRDKETPFSSQKLSHGKPVEELGLLSPFPVRRCYISPPSSVSANTHTALCLKQFQTSLSEGRKTSNSY